MNQTQRGGISPALAILGAFYAGLSVFWLCVPPSPGRTLALLALVSGPTTFLSYWPHMRVEYGAGTVLFAVLAWRSMVARGPFRMWAWWISTILLWFCCGALMLMGSTT